MLSQFAEKIDWRSKAVAYNIYSPQASHKNLTKHFNNNEIYLTKRTGS